MFKYGKKYETRDAPLLYTNELVAIKEEPIYVIADRQVFKLRIKRNRSGNHVIPFLITGKADSEKIFVYLEQQAEPEFKNLIVKTRIIRKATCDHQTSVYLSLALLNLLSSEYEFAPKAIPIFRNGKLFYK